MVNWCNALIPSLVLNGAGINTSTGIIKKKILILLNVFIGFMWFSYMALTSWCKFSVFCEAGTEFILLSWISGFKSEMSSVNLVTFQLWKACVPALNDAEVYFRINIWSTKNMHMNHLWSLYIYTVHLKHQQAYTKTSINIHQAQLFNVYEATCFNLFKRSSSGLLADRLNSCCVHSVLIQSARRPDDDRLKRTKNVASYTLNSCVFHILVNVLVYP